MQAVNVNVPTRRAGDVNLRVRLASQDFSILCMEYGTNAVVNGRVKSACETLALLPLYSGGEGGRRPVEGATLADSLDVRVFDDGSIQKSPLSQRR